MSSRMINFDKQLKGLSVLKAETAWKQGEIADVAIDPAHGTVSGLLLTTPENEELFLPVSDGIVYKETFLLNQSSVPRHLLPLASEESSDAHECLPPMLRVMTDLLGASIVTEKGKLLGNITEVYLDPRDWQAFYRVTSSWWQRWLGKGIYLPANLPTRWSQTTGRLIVPADAKQHRTVRSQVKNAAA